MGGGVSSQRGVNVPADTQREVRNADGRTGCDSLEAPVCQESREPRVDQSPSARYFSTEMFSFLPVSARNSLASIQIFVVRVNTFVCSHENKFRRNFICDACGVVFIRRKSYKWKLSQRMFASGSAVPSAMVGDVHIAHSLAGRGEMDGCALPTGTKTGRKGAEGW